MTDLQTTGIANSPTDQPTDGHDDSSGSYDYNKIYPIDKTFGKLLNERATRNKVKVLILKKKLNKKINIKPEFCPL